MPIGRRAFIALGARGAALGLAWLAVSAHTPYRQWKVYRKRRLLIVGAKTDPAGYRLTRAVAETLAAQLPDSHARPSRASNTARLASLLRTKQMDVAVLARAEAVALRRGHGTFRDVGPVELRALFALGAHLLVCRADFPEAHAYLLVQTLDQHREALASGDARLPGAAEALAVPLHAGVLVYLADRAETERAEAAESPG